MTDRCGAIAISISKCGKKHKKFYSFPTEKKLLELLGLYHGYEISERTLRRDLTWLVENKFIEKIRRTRVDASGRRVWTSNLYKLKHKFFMWVRSLEVLAKDLFSHFHRPKMAGNQLKQKPASPEAVASSVETLLIKERDGSVSRFDPRTGEYL